MRDKFNRLFEVALLAAAVGLLIFTFVYGSKMATGAEPKQPTFAELNFSEDDCVGIQYALMETYKAAGNQIPLTDVVQHIREAHFGPSAKPLHIDFVMRTVYEVYVEYPGTETGRRTILECFANAEKQKAEEKSVEK